MTPRQIFMTAMATLVLAVILVFYNAFQRGSFLYVIGGLSTIFVLYTAVGVGFLYYYLRRLLPYAGV